MRVLREAEKKGMLPQEMIDEAREAVAKWMEGPPMILHDAYTALKRLGLIASRAEYSVCFLGKRPRHFDDLVCSRRAPSVAALLSLFMRTKAIADAFAAVPSLATQASEMATLASAIWAELERRSCALLPARAKRPAAAGGRSGASGVGPR